MRVILLGIVGMLALAGLGMGAVPTLPGTQAVGNVEVEMALFNYVSPVVVVPAGTTVTWRMVQTLAGYHTITTGVLSADCGVAENVECGPDKFSARVVGGAAPSLTGATFSHTFSSAGTFPYFCKPHALLGMHGVVVVV